MARIAEGWRLRLPPGRTIHVVRFTHNGRTVDRSTGHADPEEAASAAARIYAEYVQREPGKRRHVRRRDSPPLEELVAEWLEHDSTIDPETGIKHPRQEPLETLRSYRRVGPKVMFGQNLIPRKHGTIRVGDTVRVVAAQVGRDTASAQ